MIKDKPESWPVHEHRVLAKGKVSNFNEDEIETPSGTVMRRQYLDHPGAVGIIALNDKDEIAVVDQYRHPVAHRLWEPPAGLLDISGEDPLEAAKRELVEEAELQAENWWVLVDLFTTPGACAESLRIYLATGISLAKHPADFHAVDEEADMHLHWVARKELVASILAGELSNPSLVSGVLALQAVLNGDGIESLRPANANWAARQVLVAANRSQV